MARASGHKTAAPSGTTIATNPNEFAAWVPTITGHLSFSLIGDHLADCATANAEDVASGARHVILIQARTAQDLPYVGWPIPEMFPWIRAHYIFIGQTAATSRARIVSNGSVESITDTVGVLGGTVYYVPHHVDVDQQGRLSAFLSEAERRIARFNDAHPRGTPGRIAQLEADLAKGLADVRADGVVVASADVELHRTGEFRLSIGGGLPPLLNDAGAGTTPERFVELVSQQFYYFMKDAAHVHYHHDRGADNLLPLSRTSPTDDERWRRETLWALARSVLEVRRRDHLQGYKNAFGLLAYADAFQGLLAKVTRSDTGGFVPAKSIIPYDFAHTKASLEAKIEERSWQHAGWSQFWTVTLTTLLAAVALWIGAVQIRDSVCSSLLRPKMVAAASDRSEIGPKAIKQVPLAAPGKVSSARTQDPSPAVRAADTHSWLDDRARAMTVWFEPWVNSTPPAECPGMLPVPPETSLLIALVISHPRAFLSIFILLAWWYFEFTRRSLRAARISRWAITTPITVFVAAGVTVSRLLRQEFPGLSDRVGGLFSWVLAAISLWGMAKVFLWLLASTV